MKNKVLSVIFIFLVVIICQCCSSYHAATALADVDTISIDKSIQKDSILFSVYFKSPRVIPLETKNECIIQNVRSLEIFKDDIYVLDDKANKLFVFDKNGLFKRTVSEPGRGHGEYIELADFSIDRKNGIIYLLDEATDNVLKFDLSNFEYLSTIKTDRNGYRTYSMQTVDGRVFLNRTSVDEEEKYELKEIDSKNGDQVGKLLNSDEYNNGWNFPLRLPYSDFYSKNSHPKYVGLFSNIIMNVTNEGVTPAYVVECKDFVDKNDINRILKNVDKNLVGLDFSSVYSLNKIFQISRLIESSKFLCFQYQQGNDRQYLIYDKESKKAQTSSFFYNDYVCEQNNIPMDLCYGDENGVVSLLQTSYIPYFIEHVIKKGKLKSNLDNYANLMKINVNSNPVLFWHEYKKYE